GSGCAREVITDTDSSVPVIEEVKSDDLTTQPISDAVTRTTSVSFDQVYQGQVDGAPLWLFAVPDDEGSVILSAEVNQSIVMARLDLENPEARPNWKTIVSRDEVGGVADHWHVFAHGFHYLVFSTPQANSAYVVKVDRDLNRVAMEHIVDRYEVPEEEQPPFGGEYLTTNDMFLVAEPDGVTAAFFLPTIGHKLFRMDEDLNVYETKTIGGGELAHGNGSSAIMTDSGFDVLASDTIMHLTQSAVRLLRYDSDWDFVEAFDLVDIDKQSIGMVSGVYLDDGSLVVHSRTNVDAYARGVLPPPPTPGALTDDGGNIARYFFNSDLELVSTDYLFEGTDAHRPHTSLLDDQLFTTWDAGGKTVLKIDSIVP
ncbi:MAG: hypothetical protein WC654_01665, partial [Patescibacteria group bacterium]